MPSPKSPIPQRGGIASVDAVEEPREHPESRLSHSLVEGTIEYAIFITDTKNHLLTWNPGVGHVLGYSREEWVGQDASMIFTPEDRAAGVAEREMLKARTEGRAEDIRWHLKKDGTRFYADGFLAPLYDPAGDLIGYSKVLRDAIGRHGGQEAAAQTEERLRLAAEAAGVGTFDLDPVAGELFWDERLKVMFGLPPDAPVDYDVFLAVTHPDDRERAHSVVAQALDPHGGTDGEYSVEFRPRVAEDGAERWVLARGRAYFDPERTHAVRFVGTVTDVTERRRAEEALRASDATLRASEERYRTLFNSIDVGFCVIEVLFDAEGKPNDYRFLEANPAFERHTALVGVLGRTVNELVPGLDSHWFETYGRVVMTGEPVRIEERAEAMGRWFDVYALRVGAPEERKVGVLFTDITARKQAEHDLREQGEYLRRLIENSPDCIKTLDLDGNILSISQRGASLLELADPAAVVGKNWASFFWEHEQTREDFFAARDAARSGGTGRFQGFCPTATGKPRWWDVAVVPLVGADGQPEELLTVSRDITEQVQAQAALRDSEGRLRLLTDAFPSLISYVGPDHRYVFGNRGYAEWFGIAPETLVGQHMIDVLGEDSYRDRLPHVEAVLRGEAVHFEGSLRTVDGRLRHTDTTYAPDIGPEGDVRGFFVLVQDTTERTCAEQERDALFRQEQERSRQLRQVAEASLVINSTASLSETFQVICDRAREIVGAHQSVVSITRGEAGDGTSPNWSQAINAVSLSDKYARWREYASMPDGSGIYALVCRENRILRLTQTELEAHPAWRGFGQHAAEHPPMNGWLAVPLVARDGTNLGLIQLSDKYEGEFSENDEAILVQLAQLASVAIENQRLLEEERARAARQAVLNRVNTALRSSLNPEVIEKAAVTILGEALGVDRCYMVSYRVAENYSAIASEYRSRPDDLSPMAGRYVISEYGEVMEGLYRSPEPQVVADVRQSSLDGDAVAKMEALGMRAYVRVPLYEAGILVSGIGVAMADEPRAWTPEEVELVQTAAVQVRAVVEVARAHRELEEDRAKQRRIADTLQNAMLLAPPQDAFPGVSVGTHYEPAWDEALVGGDFYDALQLDGGRVALICGDGTGKGLEAARYVSESLFVLRAYLRENPDPAVALTRLNNYMVDGQRFDGRSDNAFAAAIVAVIDTRTGEARFAAGGAEPPLVVWAATGKAEQVDVSGVVLGANPKTEFESASMLLSPGDLVVMTTDGTTEARDSRTRKFFGYEGVLRAAEEVSVTAAGSLNDVAFGVVERAKAFAGGKLGDDACVVVARFAG